MGLDRTHEFLYVSAIKIVDLTKLDNCEVLRSMWSNELAEGRNLENGMINF